MTYERFLKVLLGRKKVDEDTSRLYLEFGIQLDSITDQYHKIIDELLEEAYGKEGADWINWFSYESDYGTKDWSRSPLYARNSEGEMVKIKEAGEIGHGAHDENGNPICYSFESLWEYLEKEYGKGKSKKSK